MTTVVNQPTGGAVPVQTVPAKPKPKAVKGAVGDTLFSGFSHAFLVVWGILVVYPLLWVVLSSFKDDKQIIRHPLSLIPSSLHFDNFTRAWTKGHIGGFFLNTLIIVGGGVFLTMLLGSMAAYVLARYDFPGNRAIYYLFVAGNTLPVYMAAVPLFKGTYIIGQSVPFLGPNQYPMMILVYVAW